MFFDIKLRSWFLEQKRDLPWRSHSSPYAVLVSEIMLQQTQVSIVIPYYQRWMRQFPNFAALAESKEEEVIKAWEGLGYYSRAKNLRKAAIFICREWDGELPNSAEELSKIPGVGPYTIGAIRAFAFKQKAAAVDGNVMRVLSRYFAVDQDISKVKGQKFLRTIAEKVLPESDPWIVAEGLIELGALVCKKNPECMKCPLKEGCRAFQENLTAELPVNSKKQLTVKLFRMVPILIYQGSFLIRKVPNGEIMAGLHEFPYFEMSNLEDLRDCVQRNFKLDATPIRKLPKVQHGFTHYRVELEAYIFHCKNNFVPKGYFWASPAEVFELAFSSGHRKLLKLAS